MRDSPLIRDWGTPEKSPLAAAAEALRAKGEAVSDFITANPYDHGFQFNKDLLEQILRRAGAGSMRYAADPLGKPAAREAIAAFHGEAALPTQILLTPGTSMAYFYLFRLLARTHGEILCPAPTYPLFDDLAKIAGLKVCRYLLQKEITAAGVTRWSIDPSELEFQINHHTCAIVIVSPHNPTGTVTNSSEMPAICDVANRNHIPIILDEVFRTYALQEKTSIPRPSDFDCWLSFTLNGLSKSHYLPGMKAGWIVTEGEPAAVRRSMHSLEYISDTFLPVPEITQTAIPDLFDHAAINEVERLSMQLRQVMAERLTTNSCLPMAIPEAGPYLCIPLREESQLSEDAFVEQLLNRNHALFHPGHLYAFPELTLVSTIYNRAPWPSALHTHM